MGSQLNIQSHEGTPLYRPHLCPITIPWCAVSYDLVVQYTTVLYADLLSGPAAPSLPLACPLRRLSVLLSQACVCRPANAHDTVIARHLQAGRMRDTGAVPPPSPAYPAHTAGSERRFLARSPAFRERPRAASRSPRPEPHTSGPPTYAQHSLTFSPYLCIYLYNTRSHLDHSHLNSTDTTTYLSYPQWENTNPRLCSSR